MLIWLLAIFLLMEPRKLTQKHLKSWQEKLCTFKEKEKSFFKVILTPEQTKRKTQ